MSPQYKFTGDDVTDFPGLGLTVRPGDVVTLADPIDHPLLEPVTTTKKKADTSAPEEAK